MELHERALFEARCFSDLGSDIDLGVLPEEEKEDLGVELAKLEDEISTLRQALSAKEKHLVEIKQKMGITPLNEIKHNISKSWHDMQTSVIYKKTQETLNATGQKASAALNNVSSTLGKKLGEMKNSPAFKSFEEQVETTVSSLKCKVGVPAHSSGSFEDVLNSTANASVQESISGNRSTKDIEFF
ncbi:tumor protein D53 isoform X3 [Stegostoma tigrinum]|uniref:tumor protein D53 isoform X3 n=1 Tax=Stegostoma tigrinum TaxID=3053191 RepID=UPI00202B0DB9|nr:tumor protein D53 isoform X3 [Stegostoma tigrinum]